MQKLTKKRGIGNFHAALKLQSPIAAHFHREETSFTSLLNYSIKYHLSVVSQLHGALLVMLGRAVILIFNRNVKNCVVHIWKELYLKSSILLRFVPSDTKQHRIHLPPPRQRLPRTLLGMLSHRFGGPRLWIHIALEHLLSHLALVVPLLCSAWETWACGAFGIARRTFAAARGFWFLWGGATKARAFS